MDSKTANKNAIGHCQSECAFESQKKPSFNTPSDYPRAASHSLLEEQNSDDDSNQIDFSVEREILKRQQKKKEAEKNGTDELKPQDLPHKNSHASMLDECEDNEDEIVKALEEIDSNEK